MCTEQGRYQYCIFLKITDGASRIWITDVVAVVAKAASVSTTLMPPCCGTYVVGVG